MHRLTANQIARLDRLHSSCQFAGTQGGKEICRIIDLRTRQSYAKAEGPTKNDALEAALEVADKIGAPKSMSEKQVNENAALKAKIDELQAKLIKSAQQTKIAERVAARTDRDEETPDDET